MARGAGGPESGLSRGRRRTRVVRRTRQAARRLAVRRSIASSSKRRTAPMNRTREGAAKRFRVARHNESVARRRWPTSRRRKAPVNAAKLALAAGRATATTRRRRSLPETLDALADRAQSARASLSSRGHDEPVCSAAFSPDGTRVVTASEDKTARSGTRRPGREIAALKGHERSVVSAAFSPDGSASSPPPLTTPRACGTPRPGAKSPRSKAMRTGSLRRLQPGRQRVVTASADKTARVWDAAIGRESPRSRP